MEKVTEKPKRRSDAYYKSVYSLFLPLFRLAAWMFFGIRAVGRKLTEPSLILSNHTTDLDFLAVSAHIRTHHYIVCSEHVTAMGLFGKLFDRWFNPIKVTKAGNKSPGVMDIFRRIRNGGSVLLFCEGRLSHNGMTTEITPSTAVLAKRLKCNVVTFRTVGGFFKEPRWQTYINGGRLFGSGIVNEYSAAKVAAMTEDELYAHICEELFVDAYAEQRRRMQPFRFKRGIEDITRYYDVCPKCGCVDTLSAKGMTVECTCGYKMHMDELGFLHGMPQIVGTAAEWEAVQTEVYLKAFREGRFFTDSGVRLYRIDKGFKKSMLLTDDLTSSAEGFAVGDAKFCFCDMPLPEILSGGREMEFTANGINYMIEKDGACLNKYRELYLWWKNPLDYAKQPAVNRHRPHILAARPA